MWTWFKEFIFTVLQFFVNHVGDWGLAIIIVTVILRIILMPLTLKQQKSMANMQQLQPKLKAIQDRYKDDPQRLNEEMMKFYSENKFNPAAGCLPMFIQMPIFIALFWVLKEHVPADARFYNIIPSLVTTPTEIFHSSGLIAALPYILLVVFFGVLTLLPMFIQKNSDKNMKVMAGAMGVMMLWFGWVSPAGVLLYWDASSLWGLVQQLIINKKTKKEAEEKEQAQKSFEPIEVNVVRKEKKKRPTKKS